MDFKIITVNDTDILVHRSRNDQGEETVKITAFPIDIESNETMIETEVVFGDGERAGDYIYDFSKRSAKSWLEDNLEENGIIVDDSET